MTERLLAMLMMAEADSVAKRHQAEKRRSEAFQCYSTHPMSIGGYTERRAKVACSACDRLMSPNNTRRHRGRPSCGPSCDTKLERWRAFSGRY
ncbi:hypothetical protein OAN15_01380 [bacterium]|nr:hypothetical protein [bacterium]